MVETRRKKALQAVANTTAAAVVKAIVAPQKSKALNKLLIRQRERHTPSRRVGVKKHAKRRAVGKSTSPSVAAAREIVAQDAAADAIQSVVQNAKRGASMYKNEWYHYGTCCKPCQNKKEKERFDSYAQRRKYISSLAHLHGGIPAGKTTAEAADVLLNLMKTRKPDVLLRQLRQKRYKVKMERLSPEQKEKLKLMAVARRWLRKRGDTSQTKWNELSNSDIRDIINYHRNNANFPNPSAPRNTHVRFD